MGIEWEGVSPPNIFAMIEKYKPYIRFILIPFIPNLFGNEDFMWRYFNGRVNWLWFCILQTVCLSGFITFFIGFIKGTPLMNLLYIITSISLILIILRFSYVLFSLKISVMWNLAKNGIKVIEVEEEYINQLYRSFLETVDSDNPEIDRYTVNKWLTEKYRLKGYVQICTILRKIQYSDRRDLPYLIFRNS